MIEVVEGVVYVRVPNLGWTTVATVDDAYRLLAHYRRF